MNASVEGNSLVTRVGETLRQLCSEAKSDDELQCAFPLLKDLIRNAKSLVDYSTLYYIIISLLKQLHQGNFGNSLKISLLECLLGTLSSKQHCQCFGDCKDGCETICLWLLSQAAVNMNDEITILLLKIIRSLSEVGSCQQQFIEKLKISQMFLDMIDVKSLSLLVFNEVSDTCAKLIEVSCSSDSLNNSSFLEDLLQSERFCNFVIQSLRYNKGDYYREYIQSVLRIILVVTTFKCMTQEPFTSTLAEKLLAVMTDYHMTPDISIISMKIVNKLTTQNISYKIMFSSDRFYHLLISALKVHWERKDIVEETTKLIIFLVDNEDEKLRFYRSQLYAECCVLSNTLSKYTSLTDSSTISLLCQGILSLSQEINNERYFTDNGCCEILTRTLKDLLLSSETALSHLTDLHIQAFHDLLKVMAFFASQTKNKEKFRKSVTIPLTLQIISSSYFIKYPIMLIENIQLIRQLAKDVKICQNEYLKKGIYEFLLKIMKILKNNKNIILVILQTLIIFTDSKLGLEIFHEKRNCLIILEIFGKYLKDLEIIKRCSTFIANIAETVTNQMELGRIMVTINDDDNDNNEEEREKRDCCSLLTEALYLHLHDGGMVIEIANAVTKLGKVKNNQLKFGLSGIIALLIKALEEHQQSIPVIISICRAIRWITITSNEEEYQWKVQGTSISLINAARTGNILQLMDTVGDLSSLTGHSSSSSSSSLNSSTSFPHLHFTDDLIPSLLSQNQWKSKLFEEYYDYAISHPMISGSFDSKLTKTHDFLLSSSLSSPSSSSGNHKITNYDLNTFMNASNIIFSEKMNLNRLQFRWLTDAEEEVTNNHSLSSQLLVQGNDNDSSSLLSEESNQRLPTDGCSLLAKLLIIHLKTFPVFKVLLEAIMNLSTNLYISNKFGENNICKHLVLAIKQYYRSLECLVILLPTVKVLAAHDDNKIRFGNAEACKECIELFKHWHRHPKFIILIVNTLIPLTEDVIKKSNSSSASVSSSSSSPMMMMMNSPEGSNNNKKTEKSSFSETTTTVLSGLTVAGTIPKESFELVLTQISTNLQDISLLKVLGRFLLNLTKNQLSIPLLLYSIITNAISTYLTEPNILKLLLQIVKNVGSVKNQIIDSRCNRFGCLLSSSSNDNKNVFIEGLKRNTENNEILKELLLTLYVLLHSKENKFYFLKNCNCFHELEILLISAFSQKNTLLIPCIIQCIGSLSDYHGGEIKRNFGSLSNLFAEILMSYSDNIDIIIAIANAISLICKGNENNQRLYGNYQIPRLLTKAFFDHFYHSMMIQSLSLTIFYMNANISDNKELFGNVACCEKLFEALMYYYEQEEGMEKKEEEKITVYRILEAIKILASDSEINQKRFEHMGAFDYIAKLPISSQSTATLFSPLYRFASFASPSRNVDNQQQSTEEAAARIEADSDKDPMTRLEKNFSTNGGVDTSFSDNNEVIVDDQETSSDDEENQA
jgi:hypothetical protein